MATSPRMPVLFVGHGSPMNAIDDNPWSRGFRALGAALPTPTAVLCVSAHWYVDGTFTSGNEPPRTIHDFGGFPQALFQVQYPAPGSASLARRTAALVGPSASVSLDWGLDHGTWSVLVHLREQADLPVVQLSLDRHASPQQLVAMGRALQPLRDEGVLVMGSGNVVHNLRHAFGAMRTGATATPAWARDFDERTVAALTTRDERWLTTALDDEAGRQAHPTPDHWLPLLVAAGASRPDDALSFPITGFDLASLSMRAVRWG